MLYLDENKRIVVVGIPGVGKTTVIKKTVELLKAHDIAVRVNCFGSVMFEVAHQSGIQNRDELRKLPLSQQQSLQRTAAEKLAQINDKITIIDTHAFISSTEGYYPGLPEPVLRIIKPTNFISVSAKPENIYNRRMNDMTRNRDLITLEDIKRDLNVQSAMISACAVITGAPVKFLLNVEGKVDEAADAIVRMLEV